ncbi:hypothetical protein BH11PLA2_BH11PLA2_39500 [soil metagenome]
MATAVQAPVPTAAATGDRLLPASLLGAAVILLGVFIAGFAVPKLLGYGLGSGSFAALFARLVIQVATVVGFIYVGSKLAGENPPRGLRGGIFLVLVTVLLAFFLFRAVGLAFTSGVGQIIAGVIGFGLAFGVFKFLTSPRARDWMLGLEEMGWFSTFSYKRTQGLRMRRYTIIGILLVGLSGVWTLSKSHSTLGSGDLVLKMPFINSAVTVLTDKQFAIPLLLAAACLWAAWRAVNVPVFADFLIATEAEMNKVSWTPRKRLIQDTIVVLVTTLLLTAFLLIIDLFWGWLLSLSFVGVLPNKAELEEKRKANPVTKQVDW